MAGVGPTDGAGRESPPLDSESLAAGAPRRPIVPILVVLAALAAVVVALFVLSPWRWHAHTTARPARNGGGVILGWRAAPAARSYGVGFYDANGRVIDSIEGVETLELVLTRDALPRHLVSGSRVRWAVTAFGADRAIGRSTPDTLRLP